METAYVLEGRVTVTPDGGGSPVEVKAGGMYTFPKGMSCTWEVCFNPIPALQSSLQTPQS